MMNNSFLNSLISRFFTVVLSLFAPLALLLLLAFVPVSHAADIIPESNNVAVADTQAPADVENVKATPGDGVINLTWNVAMDNVGVKGYKIYYGPKSVTTDGASYTQGPVDVGNVIAYSLKSPNGAKVYIAVTAYDAAGNESENYSLEASAAPSANLKSAADTEAPKVAKAEAIDKNHVRVTFSEPIVLLAKNPQSAFSIKNDASSVLLEVQDAKMDDKDLTGKAVILTTADQQANIAYVLTAGIDIKDSAGNPIISGTSDTGTFTGTTLVASTDQQVAAVVQAESGPRIVSVQAPDATHAVVTFSEAMSFKASARDNFIVTEKDTVENVLNISDAAVNDDKTIVTLTTADQKAIKYSLVVIDATNKDGQKVPLDVNAVEFMGGGTTSGTTDPTGSTVTPSPSENTPPEDKTAPEDVTAFMAKMLKKLIVTLSWKDSANTAGDLAQYILYMSTDGVNYGEGIPVSPGTKAFDVTSIVPKVKYFFKLTARDQAGNESKGVITTFTLPGTGPEMGFVLVGSLLAGKFWKKRKNLKK